MRRENIFLKKKNHEEFTWEKIGNIAEGRGDLGEEMPVLVYRIMQYTILDVLSKAHGLEQANKYFHDAGFLAGNMFANNLLDLKLDFDAFISHLQEKLREFKIGVLRIEEFNTGDGSFVLTVAQDLDCSGLPVTNENVCIYDEGFIAGIFKAYTGKDYEVREIDCWASGDRVCRFEGVCT